MRRCPTDTARPVDRVYGPCEEAPLGTVLIVDDESALLEVMAIVLRDAGHAVLRAPDGEAALQLLRANRVDLVISDVMMPRIGGPELLAAHVKAGGQVPFVFVSSLSERIVRGLVGTAPGYLAKPFSLEGLMVIVAERLQDSRPST